VYQELKPRGIHIVPIFEKFLGRRKDNNYITIVTGLPRSGTSMLMGMLVAGGIEAVTDGVRKPDESNPKGYYEFENVKKIQEDVSWLGDCRGKAVKIISELLFYLPDNRAYKIIFMRRHIKEILASQHAMLSDLGRYGANRNVEEMIELFSKHIMRVEKWLKGKSYDVLYLDYRNIIMDSRKNAESVNRFLDFRLNIAKMVSIVDSKLYRQKESNDKKAQN
jgi:hypothetical protein